MYFFVFNFLKNKKDYILFNKKNNFVDNNKFHPSIIQEWNSSVYYYNKNAIKNLPVLNKTINRFIKNFFNLTFILKNKILSTRRRIRLNRTSTNRVFISKALIKQRNDKLVVLLFSYNREKFVLLKKLKKLYVDLMYNKKRAKKKLLLEKKIKDIKIKTLDKNLLKKIKKEKKLVIDNIKWNIINRKLVNYKTNKFYTSYSYIFNQEKLFLFYNKILLLNTYKFNNFFLIKLKQLLIRIFNKHVEFKIINIKKLYLNSDIFIQSLAIKLKNRKNILNKVLNKALLLVKLPILNKYLFFNHKLNKVDFILTKLNSFIFFNKNICNFFFSKCLSFNYNKNVNSFILNSLNHKYINGIKLEAKGRLSKRLTAQRSKYKCKYKGNIKNIDSTNHIPTVVLKGYNKSNLQYTNTNSKNRNGSFGLKGWISSY